MNCAPYLRAHKSNYNCSIILLFGNIIGLRTGIKTLHEKIINLSGSPYQQGD